MTNKESLEKVMRIRIEAGDVLVTEAMEDCIIEYIKETLKRFKTQPKADCTTFRKTMLKVKEEEEVIELYVKVSAQTTKDLKRNFTFYIEK